MKIRFQADADLNQAIVTGVVRREPMMPRYFSEFIASQNSSGVIIVLKAFPIREVIDNLIRVWQTSEADDWINRIAYLPI